MAATPLKLNTPAAAPRRVTLKTSAPAPTSKVRLLGSNGKAIEPKKKEPAPAAEETPAPSAETAAVDEAALKAAEEADRLAQEEYERQMAEYEKQMEEYNRQMAEYEAAEKARQEAEAEAARKAEEEARKAAEEEARKAEEAAAAAAAEEAPAPAPKPKAAAAKPKLAVAKPAGLKPAGLKPAGAKLAKPATKPAAKAAPAPAPAAEAAPAIPMPTPEDAPAPADAEPMEEPELTEEEIAARDAYLEGLQKQAEAPKIWKTPMFKYGCIAFGVVMVGLGVLAFVNNQKNKAIEEHRNYINQYLTIAQNLNKQGIETLADVKEKNVKFDCPPEAAKDLLSLVVNPYVKRADGKNKFGANPEGVAQNACLVLAIAAEQNPDIDKLIFTTLGERCQEMKPALFSWLLQRVSISNNKGVKGKLKKLAKTVGATPNWKKKSEILSSVWSCIGLRVSPKDIDEIVALLKDDSTDSMLTKTLCICLCNVTDMMDASPERQAAADDIFGKVDGKDRERLIDSLAKASSPKAYAFYKSEMEDPAVWTSDGQLRFANAIRFFSSYGDDEIIDYLVTLKEKAGENAAHAKAIDGALQTAFVQNRERTDEDTQRLVALIYDKINEDTSAWQDIINKIDPDSADFVGEDSAELETLKERKADLEKCRKQKNHLINSLASLRDYKWVTKLLESYTSDPDADIATRAAAALEKVKKNSTAFMQLQMRFKARGTQQ